MNSAYPISRRIYVAGHTGLVGSAIVQKLRAHDCRLILRTHQELELTDAAAVGRFFADERPEFVVIAAARVGGILANSDSPAEFIRENLSIATNLIHESWRAGVQRLLFLGSSCIYPREAPQPIQEESLLTGPLEATNRPYAIAKIAGIEMCWAYNRQYGTKFLSLMPCNLYGPGDSYHPHDSHVLPAMIRRLHEATVSGAQNVTFWGTGTPRREFLHSDDLASACSLLLAMPDPEFITATKFKNGPPLLNVGSGFELTIAELANMVATVVGYRGEIRFDHERPDGTMRKLLDSSRMRLLGWEPRIALADGLASSYQDFLRRVELPVTTHEAH